MPSSIASLEARLTEWRRIGNASSGPSEISSSYIKPILALREDELRSLLEHVCLRLEDCLVTLVINDNTLSSPAKTMYKEAALSEVVRSFSQYSTASHDYLPANWTIRASPCGSLDFSILVIHAMALALRVGCEVLYVCLESVHGVQEHFGTPWDTLVPQPQPIILTDLWRSQPHS
jgi:hypothetical protein